MNALRKDILSVSLIILVIGILLLFSGIVMRNEGITIVSTILILAPIPFLASFWGKTKNNITARDLYKNMVIALIFISIISLVGYFTFVTVMGKAISLAIFIGTMLSLIIDYLNFRKERIREAYRKNIDS